MENRQEANHRESQGEDHQADSSGDFLKACRSFHGRNSFFLRFWSSPWTVRYSVQMIFKTPVSGFEKKVKNYFGETVGSNMAIPADFLMATRIPPPSPTTFRAPPSMARVACPQSRRLAEYYCRAQPRVSAPDDDLVRGASTLRRAKGLCPGGTAR
jgi:hypothetical protein